MSGPTRKNFTLTDGEGVQHQYEMTPLAPVEALPLGLEIMALGAKPLLRLVASGEGVKDAAERGEMPTIDADKIGDDLVFIFAKLQERPDMLRQLFRDVKRDGKLMEADIAFNDAYRGNWTELWQAIFKLVQCNGFLSFGGLSQMTPESQ